MEARDLKFLNAFNSIPAVGPASLRLLKNHFGVLETAWRAGENALQESGITTTALQAILWKRPSLQPDREMEKLVRENIWLITEEDERYPPLLKEIPSPPLLLYGKGALPQTRFGALAVVGTRRPTAYGLEATEKIVQELAGAGLTIVSGLATGIDTRAHEACLEVKGRTIAVLGSGVDQNSIFPPENRGLGRRIVESDGAIISEYAPGTPAVKEHFPARNRIISGLSLGVLVSEAREKSGARITARYALDQNREVFALPGSIFSPTSRWPNRLIQEGAKLVTCAADILEELGMDYTKERVRKSDELLGEKEKVILELVEEPLSVDVIKEKTGLETSAIVASLSMLELKGRVKNLGADTYQKVN